MHIKKKTRKLLGHLQSLRSPTFASISLCIELSFAGAFSICLCLSLFLTRPQFTVLPIKTNIHLQ